MMHIGRYEFRFNLVLTLTMLLLLALFIRLGFWQLQRAGEKAAVLAEYNQNSTMPAIDLTQTSTDEWELFKYRKVTVKGRFIHTHQFLLDNKVHNGVPGYYVISPLQLLDGRVLLINRGWIALGRTRSELPDISLTSDMVEISGLLTLPRGDEYRIGDSISDNQVWPRVIQWLDPSMLEPLLEKPLLPIVVQMDSKEDAGYVRDWKWIAQAPEKSISYAVQWFSFAITLFLIYLFIAIKRSDKEE